MNLYAVLTIEYLRRVRYYWLLAVLLFIGGPGAFVTLLWLKGYGISQTGASAYSAPYLGIALLLLPLFTLVAQWQIYPHLYHRPMTTRALALWLMLTGAITIAGTNVLFILAYRLLFGATWPILAPSLFFATFAILAQSINWNLLRPSVPKIFAGLLVIAGALWWFARRYHPFGLDGPSQPWLTPSAGEIATMAAASVGAALLGIHGLSRARHESEGTIDPAQPYDITNPFASACVPALADVPEALNWFFWQRGMMYAVGASGTIILALGLLFAFSRDDLFESRRALETIAGMSFFVPVLVASLVGLAFGLDFRHPVTHVLTPFLATRPVTTEQLSKTLLWNAFKSTLTVWSLIISALILYSTGFFLKSTPAELLAALRSSDAGLAAVPLTLVGSFLASWIGLSWLAVLGWSGREKVVIAGVFLIIGYPMLFLPLLQLVVPRAWSEFALDVALWTPAVLIAVVTLDLAGAARRGELLSPGMQLLLAGLALGIVAFFGILIPGPAEVKVLACLYALAAVLPIPSAPLMLEWNRHR